MDTYEIVIKKKYKDSWHEIIKPTDKQSFIKAYNQVINTHKDEKGSYFFSFKINGGVKKDPDNGATLQTHWKGNFIHILRILKFEYPPDIPEYYCLSKLEYNNRVYFCKLEVNHQGDHISKEDMRWEKYFATEPKGEE